MDFVTLNEKAPPATTTTFPLPPRMRLCMAVLQHECGIAAIYHLDAPTASPLCPPGGPDQVSRLIPRMLSDLQNRGQLAAGFTSFEPQRGKILDTFKQIGSVIEALRLNH